MAVRSRRDARTGPSRPDRRGLWPEQPARSIATLVAVRARTTINSARPRGGWLAAIAGSALALAAHPTPLFARQPTPTVHSGRDFGAVTLTAPAQAADVVLAAQRVRAWTEPARPGGAAVRRLVLDGAVRVTIGAHDFNAARAVVWVEPVESEGRALQQVAVYFENVQDLGADAVVAQSADRLLVTAVVDGELKLKADTLAPGRTESDVLRDGEARFARFLDDATAGPAGESGVSRRPDPGAQPPGGAETDFGPELPPAHQPAPILPLEGVITFTGPDRTLVTGETENAVVITGGVVVQYTPTNDDGRPPRTLQLSADSAVVFLDPGRIVDLARAGPGEVRGVYLEGDVVATDGSYTLRGKRFFYDVTDNRGVALDAVFWTYDERSGMPLYVRADAIRQETQDQWSAGDARLANTEFFEPHFSLGVSSITVSRAPRHEGAGPPVTIDAQGVTAQVGGSNVIGLPSYKGDPIESVPLRRLSVGTKDGDAVIRSEWDLLNLLGVQKPEGLDIGLLVDGYFSRGPAAGLDADWSIENAEGKFFSYYVHDQGRDKLTSGATIDPSQENRGMVTGEHRWSLDDQWTLFLEAAWISDPSFVDAFFPRIAETGRELTNSIYARSLEEAQVFTAEVRGSLNDFTPNEYLMQSLGYSVQRTPEFSYWRFGDELFDGALRHASESRLSYMAQNFNEPLSREIGFDTIRRSSRAFGLTPDQSLAERLRAQGYTEDSVLRFDSRHELSAPLAFGPLNVNPYMVGRFTGYDDDFSEFRGPAGDDDSLRLWGSAGVDISTTLVHIDDSAQSSLLDVDRIRHIIEPSASLWSAGTNLQRENLPIYDETVESISEGAAWRAGIASTWQTKRAGPDGVRSVDWIKLTADYVDSTSDTDQKTPIGRWSRSRPEQSVFGEYVAADATMQLTDAVALSGTGVYDFELDGLSAGAAGLLFDHGFGLTSFAEARRLDAPDTLFVSFGAAYELTRKYAIEGEATFDVEEGDFQAAGFTLTRRFPQWTLEIGVDIDEIRDDVSVSFVLVPVGVSGERRNRVFTREADVMGRPLPAPLPDWGVR